MSNLSSLKPHMNNLAERLHDAKRLLAHHAPTSAEHTQSIADFQNRYDALLAKIGKDGEVDLNAVQVEHKTLEQELSDWVSDIDRRFNEPAKKNQSASM